jgi:hypothetical protein
LEEAVEGATYLRGGAITRPLEGVKNKQTTAEFFEKFATIAVDEKGEEKAEGKEKEEELQLLNSSSEESGEETDSIPEAEIQESLNHARRRGPGLKDW